MQSKEAKRKYYRRNRKATIERAKLHYENNKEQRKTYIKIWQEKNPGKVREYTWKQYGIQFTWEQYQKLLVKQKFRCAVCRRHPEEFSRGRPLDLDHDHITKRVRGLLCESCNKGIGQLGDTIDRVGAAYQYLKRAAKE